jgi:hypothetical protein
MRCWAWIGPGRSRAGHDGPRMTTRSAPSRRPAPSTAGRPWLQQRHRAPGRRNDRVDRHRRPRHPPGARPTSTEPARAAMPCLRRFPSRTPTACCGCRQGRAGRRPPPPRRHLRRRRLDGICAAGGGDLAALDLDVITAPTGVSTRPTTRPRSWSSAEHSSSSTCSSCPARRPPARGATQGLHERAETAALGCRALGTRRAAPAIVAPTSLADGRGALRRDAVQGGSRRRNDRWCSSPRELVTSWTAIDILPTITSATGRARRDRPPELVCLPARGGENGCSGGARTNHRSRTRRLGPGSLRSA